MTLRVLFVCLGNICRSPMAEAVFQNMINDAGLSDQVIVESAGTGAWHIGERAHGGTRDVLARHDITYEGRAQQVTRSDMVDPDTFVIAMDNNNVRDLQHHFGKHPRLYRLLDFATETDLIEVPDPYYSGGFDKVYALVEDGCRGLLAFLIESGVLESA
jgi:protein-tyrosine phosphatase